MTGPPVAVVVGPPGAGKTTVGELLAERLGAQFRDVDADIVAAEGKPIADIFTADGEPRFRALEREAVATALAEHGGVVALGGGAVLAEATRDLLAAHRVVFLNVGMAEGVRRTGMSTARPLLAGLNPRATFRVLLDERVPLYREVATVEVDTDATDPAAVADTAARLLSRVDTSGRPDGADTGENAPPGAGTDPAPGERIAAPGERSGGPADG